MPCAFRLSGVDLEGEAKARYREISLRLSELGGSGTTGR